MESRAPFRRGEVPNWEYVKLERGKFANFFLAGPVFGVATHYYPHTRACQSDVTDGELECFCKAQKLETRWRGYVPLWDEQGVRWVVIIGERYGPQAMRLEHLQPVRVSKLSTRGTPLRVDGVNWNSVGPRLEGADREPQDIRRWLIKVWQDPVLLEWWKSRPRTPVATKPKKRRIVPDVGFAKRVEDIATVIVPKVAANNAGIPGTLGDALNGVLKNGQHRKQ